MFNMSELRAAAELVHAHMPPTPQYAWPQLGARIGGEIWVKHENHTPTGAFKVRGGLVYLDELMRKDPDCPGNCHRDARESRTIHPVRRPVVRPSGEGVGAGRQCRREELGHARVGCRSDCPWP